MPYLGFLPQDMLGHSILEFYHPEDMPLMKEVYEAGVWDIIVHMFPEKKFLVLIQHFKWLKHFLQL